MSEPKGSLSLQTIAMPADTNWGGNIFGGWLLSQMDLAGAIYFERVSQGRCATIAIQEITFLVPVKVGDVVSCYTEVIKVGRTSMQLHVQVWSVNSQRSDPVKVTEGTLTYVAIDEAGHKRPLPTDMKI